jgi:uncharacterized protein YggU (UPF0235/DUF167 family)
MVKQPAPGAPKDSSAAPIALPSLTVAPSNGALIFWIRVTPRSSRDALTIDEGQVRARLRAAPVDGAANAALVVLLASRLRAPRSAITIIRGETARLKQVAITGLTADDLHQRFAALTGPSDHKRDKLASSQL